MRGRGAWVLHHLHEGQRLQAAVCCIVLVMQLGNNSRHSGSEAGWKQACIVRFAVRLTIPQKVLQQEDCARLQPDPATKSASAAAQNPRQRVLSVGAL